MEGIGFYTNILTSNDAHVDGLDDLSFSFSQGTQQTNDVVPSELENDVVHVVAPEVAGRNRGAKVMAKRTKNFDPKEDVVVCSAWVNVSKDPITGANQPRSSFWRRILDYFEKHKTTPFVRTESSIMHRWLIIQKEVNKYCSCYEAIENKNRSGATIQDTIVEASEMYTGVDEDHKSFTLLHCWNKLKDEEKWKTKRIELAELQKQSTKKKQKVSKDSTPKNVQANNTEELEEIGAPGSEERKRPQGQKAAKEALRRGGGGDACMEALDKMWAKKEAFDMDRERKIDERFLLSLEVENKRLTIEEKKTAAKEKKAEAEAKKAEAEFIKEEKEIMSVDMSSLTPLQKQYYETMQKNMIARRLAN